MEASGLHPPRFREFVAQHHEAHPESWTTQLRWFATAGVVGFAVPFLGSSVLDLQHDVYLGIYFAVVLGLLWVYAVATELNVRAVLTRNWKPGVLLGLVFGFLLVRNVYSDGATPHPGGAYFWFELVWRGALYGAVDALLLTVLPCVIVYRSLGGPLGSWRKRLAYFACALGLVATMTAVYHLGFSQYREDGVRQPETGNTIISMPMLLTANPIGSVADHMAMHISAVAHTYETDVRLPPPAKSR